MSNTSDPTGFSDGREPGDFRSKYPCDAWIQIIIEFTYLLVVLFLTTFVLLKIGLAVTDRSAQHSNLNIFNFNLPWDRKLLVWVSIGLSGVAGGTAFDLKWLYHSVAKNTWNRDRVLWRVTVPPLSGVLAVFLGCMIVSGLIPIFNGKAFSNFPIALGFGFFIGLFSDNVLASLKHLANRTFGTVDRSPATVEDRVERSRPDGGS